MHDHYILPSKDIDTLIRFALYGYTGCPKKKWHYRNYLIVLKPLLNARDYTAGNLMNLYLHLSIL
jgi:hypothetical protein